MLQFFSKANRNCIIKLAEITPQIHTEVMDQLFRLLRVLFAKLLDRTQGVVDEVGPHLQQHDAGVLVGDFPLLAHILFDLIMQ